MFCSECGEQVTENAKFCTECGSVQEDALQTPKTKVEQVGIKVTLTSESEQSTESRKVYVESVASGKVPKNITIAIWLMWITLLISIPQFLNSVTTIEEDVGGIIIFVLLFLVCITFWVTVKLREGKNWMRVSYSILTVLTCIVNIQQIGNILHLVQLALYVLFVFLLYSESASAYFKSKSNDNIVVNVNL